MTPQERQQVEELFDRLAKLENAPRDADAEGLIARAQARAPNAIYALVQTVLVQDEALRRADERIAELEGTGSAAPASGSFLDSMRDALFGRDMQRGSVPSVRPGSASDAPWNAQQPQPQASGGGSFLGTAAAAAAGVIGGSLLLNGIRSMMGPEHRQALFDTDRSGNGGPWTDQSSSDLAREAGINDIGGNSKHASLFDSGGDDVSGHDVANLDSDDFGDTDFGGDDFA